MSRSPPTPRGLRPARQGQIKAGCVPSPGRLVEEGDEDGAGDGLLGPGDGAPGARHGGVADVDVALEGEQQRQPDGRRVEDLRHVLHHGVVRVARLLVGDGAVVAQREHLKVPASAKANKKLIDAKVRKGRREEVEKAISPSLFLSLSLLSLRRRQIVYSLFH